MASSALTQCMLRIRISAIVCCGTGRQVHISEGIGTRDGLDVRISQSSSGALFMNCTLVHTSHFLFLQEGAAEHTIVFLSLVYGYM